MRSAVIILVWWCLAHSLPTVAQQTPFPANQSKTMQFPKLTKEVLFRVSSVFPEDREFSVDIRAGNTSRYFHLHGAFGPLTLVLRPCGHSVNSTVYHEPPQSNASGYLKDYMWGGRGETSLGTTHSSSQHVYSWTSAPAGLYVIDLAAEGEDTAVTMYATNKPVAPAVLRIQQTPRLRLQPRLHRNRVTLRWDQSVVDPQMLHYVVVVNSVRNFSCLCEAKAQSARGANVIDVSEKPSSLENKIHKKAIADDNYKADGRALGLNDILIKDVGPNLSFTISSLQKGRDYYFNIFAMVRQTQLSFWYANAALKYDPKLKPIRLKDNKPETVNIRKKGGRALFRYKVRAGQALPDSILSFHVMPCGGAVMAEVRFRKRVVVPRLKVESYHHLQVPNVSPGQRYTLLVHVPDAHQMRQILGVEVLATVRTSPLPQLPSEAQVLEIPNMRSCHSVTVAWLPVPTQSVRYCVSASPVPVTETEDHFRPRPNQCNLDHRLSTQYDIAVKQCQDVSANDHSNVLVQTISKLRPGKEYLIQVTVKKIKGKALSYNLLRVRTKISDC